MPTVRFRAVLADGRVYDGPLQANGGRLGNGAAHLGQAKMESIAVSTLRGWIRAASPRATVALIQTGPAGGDGEWDDRVEVPLLGTRWYLLPAPQPIEVDRG